MKKLLIITLLFYSIFSQAQKIGYVDFDAVLSSIPGIDSVNIKFQAQQTALKAQLDVMKSDFDAKYKVYNTTDTGFTTLIRKTQEEELITLQAKIDTFQVRANKELQLIQQRLVVPFINKARQAINAVAVENKYSMILNYDPSFILYRKEADDIFLLVKKKIQ